EHEGRAEQGEARAEATPGELAREKLAFAARASELERGMCEPETDDGVHAQPGRDEAQDPRLTQDIGEPARVSAEGCRPSTRFLDQGESEESNRVDEGNGEESSVALVVPQQASGDESQADSYDGCHLVPGHHPPAKRRRLRGLG